MKASHTATLLSIGALLLGSPQIASAQKFNSLIPNPFVFCSAPKPCRLCQPFRAIYQELCADQTGGKSVQQNEPVTAGAIAEHVNHDGQKWFTRTVNGWTLRAVRRTDLEDASLNSDSLAAGVEVIDGPIKEILQQR